MSLALDLASDSLNSQSPTSITVFAPAEAAFSTSGQPNLDLIRLHLLPVAFPLRSLKSLPFGAKIATLLDGHSLTVTTLPADGLVSLNNVTVTATPVFDDGSLIIFGIDRFFSRYFRISGTIPKILGGCLAPRNPNEATAAFGEASEVLRSNGCSVMASFLEMQFHGFRKYQTMLTVFAPVDRVMAHRIGDLSRYSSVLRRHVVPCRLSWSDLKSLEDGSLLRTDLQGFVINVSRYDGVVELNGVSVIMPEMYHNGWLVVHGISEVLGELPQSPTDSRTEPNPVVPSPPHESQGSSGAVRDLKLEADTRGTSVL
uniref:putative fasciclin-like arabinogalactan protein 20 n=1 Tax=Fragaria vesca subsp. vesca TaxID=101020 RepID=UPI0005C8789D|nr:PREDICTED: putative fasciclin-like arabinogalactan protein 20 [Fragaria vesca subsp. vesca]